MLSYWEKNSFLSYDYVVLGAGIVGFSTAYHIKKKNPKASIAILERGVLPSGASTKNAGFACFGSLTELLDDLDTLTTDELMRLVEKRWKGLIALRNILGDESIDFQDLGGYELIEEDQFYALNSIDEMNGLLSGLFNGPVFEEQSSKVKKFKFAQSHVKTIVKNKYEGQIDTGKMMRSWWDLCNEMGIRVLTGITITAVNSMSNSVELKGKGVLESDYVFNARKLAVCTNAFATKLLPKIRLNPGRGMILLTAPSDKIPFSGTFHVDRGYVYFRNIHNRILIGGGRNIAVKEEETHDFGINAKIKDYLLKYLNDIISPKEDSIVEQAWSGIMAFGKNRFPIVESYDKNIGIGVKMGGMGVAVGTQIGQELSQLLLAE